MTSTAVLARKSAIGSQAKRLRMYGLLTRRDLAEAAGVPLEHVELFEHNLPVPLDSRRRILRELWSRKTYK